MKSWYPSGIITRPGVAHLHWCRDRCYPMVSLPKQELIMGIGSELWVLYGDIYPQLGVNVFLGIVNLGELFSVFLPHLSQLVPIQLREEEHFKRSETVDIFLHIAVQPHCCTSPACFFHYRLLVTLLFLSFLYRWHKITVFFFSFVSFYSHTRKKLGQWLAFFNTYSY